MQDVNALLRSIEDLSTGLGLVSFFLVIVLLFYRSRNKSEIDKLKAMPADQKSAALLTLAGRWSIPTHGLSGAAQERLILAEMRAASRWKLIVAGLLFTFACALLVFASMQTAVDPGVEDGTSIGELGKLVPGEVTVTYATSILGTPIMQPAPRQHGVYIPEAYFGEVGRFQYATYQIEDLIVDVSYSSNDEVIQSVVVRPRLDAEINPDWMENLPSDFREILDGGFEVPGCRVSTHGGVGSATEPWEFIVSCGIRIPGYPPIRLALFDANEKSVMDLDLPAWHEEGFDDLDPAVFSESVVSGLGFYADRGFWAE